MNKLVKRRPYVSALRKEQAARTRMLITEAAAGLFVSEGYARTTVRAIAERAGVAPDTVYAVFGSKVGVLTAVLNARLAPSGEVSVMDRAESRAVRDEPDQRRQLHRFAHDMAGVSEQIRPIYEVLRTAGAAEPEVGQVFTEMERHRLAHMRQLAGWFARRGPLGVSQDRAADILFVLASPDVARMLCDVRGWSQAQHAAWLETMLSCALLLEDPGTG
jgi:AcrR family transcriptional regulator